MITSLTKSIIIAALFFLLQVSIADDPTIICKNAQHRRKLVVVYFQENKKVPCQLVYYKETERPGDIKIPYEAKNSIGFCEKKAVEMQKEFENAGWSCSQSGDF